ncbi:hypothetical protein DGWBC_1270 [Dehalogenimonas sp. WBC-2]|nr:hypothetical protein DGWBC_1270 [Dehalogenimonas sp. WBC-2]
MKNTGEWKTSNRLRDPARLTKASSKIVHMARRTELKRRHKYFKMFKPL